MSHVPPPKRHPYDQWSPDARALDLVGDKWTLLIVRDLISGPRRFVELQRVLPGISTEQLRSRLNRMVADGMLTRKRYREVPPRVDYELTQRAQELAPVLGELARWGYEWAWGPPRTGENVDIGAIFRLLPGLVGAGRGPTGTAELIVSDGHEGEPASYLVTVGRGGASVSERDIGRAGTRVRGTVDGWVQALSPLGERSGLRVTGDPALADSLLDVLAFSERRRAMDSDSGSAAAL
jgi:DNA-binding HxlR family transcriptional regulator